MKKLIIFLLTALFILQSVVIAQENTEFNVYTSRTKRVISKIEADIDGECVAAIYLKENNMLYTVSPVTMENGTADVEIPYPQAGYIFRLYYDIGSDKYFSVSGDEVKYLPNTDDETNNDESIDEDNNDNTPGGEEDTNNDNQDNSYAYPGVYESEAVANGAFAVVKESEKVVNADDEIVNKLLLYYMGTEMYVEINEDTPLVNEWSYAEVNDISELVEGDVVKLSANLTGKILRVTLLFRNFDYDLAADEEGRELLDEAKDSIYDGSMIFGVITNKLNNNVLVISDGTGLDDNAQYLALHPETVVYYYDNSLRNNKLSISTVGEIHKSEIASADKDADGNITAWHDDDLHHYAVARVHDGLICDIIVYANY